MAVKVSPSYLLIACLLLLEPLNTEASGRGGPTPPRPPPRPSGRPPWGWMGPKTPSPTPFPRTRPSLNPGTANLPVVPQPPPAFNPTIAQQAARSAQERLNAQMARLRTTAAQLPQESTVTLNRPEARYSVRGGSTSLPAGPPPNRQGRC